MGKKSILDAPWLERAFRGRWDYLCLRASVLPTLASSLLSWKRVFMGLLGLLVLENLPRWVALSMAWRRSSTREFLVIGTILLPFHALD